MPEGALGRVPIPKPGFLDSCQYLGYIYGERRWRGQIGLIYTWDGLHGELEIVDPRGRHLGAADALTGFKTKTARKERRIRV